MQFLNLINTDPVLYNMACFGIEGVHYTLNENGTVTSNEAAGYNLIQIGYSAISLMPIPVTAKVRIYG